jgi:transcriptional regulator with XRE-family HTH domain
MNIGQKIREYRKNKALKLVNIAERTGLSKPFISEIERGIKSPSIETLSKICSALDITLAEFFTEEEPSLSPELRKLLDSARDLSPEQVEQLNRFILSMKN